MPFSTAPAGEVDLTKHAHQAALERAVRKVLREFGFERLHQLEDRVLLLEAWTLAAAGDGVLH